MTQIKLLSPAQEAALEFLARTGVLTTEPMLVGPPESVQNLMVQVTKTSEGRFVVERHDGEMVDVTDQVRDAEEQYGKPFLVATDRYAKEAVRVVGRGRT